MLSEFKIILWLGIGLLVLLAIVIYGPYLFAILPWLIAGISYTAANGDLGQTSSYVTDRGVYYRISTKYLVDGIEPLDFDIVVACGKYRTKTVSSGKGGVIPSVYAKRTANNHAVVVSTPDFCSNAEIRNLGQISGVSDGAFLPFTVWFDDANDLQMGLGYASIFAFENPSARLTFLGARVRYATREEFEDWYQFNNANLITNEMLHASPYSEAGWILDETQILPKSCYGIGFIQANGVAQSVLRKYWPADRPDLWVIPQKNRMSWFRPLKDFQAAEGAKFQSFDLPEFSLSQGGQSLDWDWPSPIRAHLSLDLSKLSNYQEFRYQPTEKYPVYFNDALPTLKEGQGETFLSANIDFRPEMKGFVACYLRYPKFSYPEIEMQSKVENYYFGDSRANNDFRLTVNGQLIQSEDSFSDLGNFLIFQDKSIGRFNQFSFLNHISYVD